MMVDLSTSFAGLTLQSPLILGSSGLTRNVDRARTLVEAGVGAVILKSLFEEQILMQTGHLVAKNDYPEANDYISSYVRSEAIEDYIRIVREAKAKLTVPVIASINCTEAGSWVEFAERLRDAGADALEVNVMRLETELFADPAEIEAYYVSIVTALAGKGLPNHREALALPHEPADARR